VESADRKTALQRQTLAAIVLGDVHPPPASGDVNCAAGKVEGVVGRIRCNRPCGILRRKAGEVGAVVRSVLASRFARDSRMLNLEMASCSLDRSISAGPALEAAQSSRRQYSTCVDLVRRPSITSSNSKASPLPGRTSSRWRCKRPIALLGQQEHRLPLARALLMTVRGWRKKVEIGKA